MRRPIATVLAVLAMLTHVALAAAAPLGVVLCVGESHAAIELAADDCCSAHAHAADDAPTAIARTCCSDVPLYAAVSLVDAQRASHSSAVLRPVATAAGVLAPAALGELSAASAVPFAVAAFARRSPALRV
jgi:hypothetical protein